jgi:N-acetylmuramoyl-L-alanine amidase
MLASKLIAVLLSATISVNSAIFFKPPPQNEIPLGSEEFTTEVVEVFEEPTVEIIQEEIIEEELPLSDEDIDLIALCVMGEAEGESEEGQRLVIDVILNRLDSPKFADTIPGVIYAKNAFECMTNGRVDRCYVREDIRQLVIEELKSRTNSNIHYFRTNHYHNFGVPVMQVGNHYFSTY